MRFPKLTELDLCARLTLWPLVSLRSRLIAKVLRSCFKWTLVSGIRSRAEGPELRCGSFQGVRVWAQLGKLGRLYSALRPLDSLTGCAAPPTPVPKL